MKKLISAVTVISVLVSTIVALSVLTPSAAYAAEPLRIQVKNQADVAPMTISSDVKPEMKNNRTMVPLRVISENLGAAVNWSDSEVVLTKSDVKVVLQLNSSKAMKNSETMRLDVKPYLKNNHMMVPLRFIAEMFDCNVSYSNFTVTFETKPLVIDGVQVKALQQEYHMTMGGVENQIHGNTFNEAIYHIFVQNRGKKVEAPANYSWNSHPNSGDYYKSGQYDFLDQQGNSIKQFDIYTLVRVGPTEGDPEVLIYDANETQWYRFSYTASQAIWRIIDTAAKYGFLTEISNTVP